MVTVGFRLAREVVGRFALAEYGLIGAAVVVLVLIGVVVGWRVLQRRRVKAQGGEELTPEAVVQQLVDSGLGGPAYGEDGTLYGASLFAVNQRTKLIELNTEYEVFGSDGRRLANVRQIGQSRAKHAARLFTGLDQFFTHHFDVVDPGGTTIMRLSRPRKIFLTKVHVFDGQDQYLGMIRQENVFWKIGFALTDPVGNVVGRMKAEKLQAWDFQVTDPWGRHVATIVKSWEGWARTAMTRADRYTVRIHQPLVGHLHPLTVATAMSIDLALKQDSRAFG